MSTLLSVEQAQAIILKAVQTLGVERISLRTARSRILAEALIAKSDMPPFDNSSADGFAVQAADTQSASLETPVTLTVVGDIPAGNSPLFSIGTGQTARIMTGAPIPAGADSVVMVEATDVYTRGLDTTLPKKVRIFSPVNSGDSVRPHGQDAAIGSPLFPIGHHLRPQDLGLLASQGFAELLVYRQPRIAILSTGDELVALSEALGPGKIYDSNSYMLAALLEEYGATVTRIGFVPDDESAIRQVLDECVSAGIELLITTAGVSVGAFDFVRKVITEQGELNFWKVDMRPGKPLAFGSYHGIPLIGLPGNPVSAFVGCLVFAIPAVKKLAGDSNYQVKTVQAKLLEPVESDGRESYLRAILEHRTDGKGVRLSGHQGSGNLYALTRSNALLFLPSGVKSLPAGFNVKVYPLLNNGEWD
ncbi:molybdopterin molybdotransferase MoeA [bacterium]|nr:MAG: molybdopterin molybdotransferase MoeA [bacterium]